MARGVYMRIRKNHILLLFLASLFIITIYYISPAKLYYYQSNVYSEIIVLNENSTIPSLIAPSNESEFIKGELITFEWSAVENVSNYTLLIDMAKNFSTDYLIKIQGIHELEYTLNTTNLSYGIWYWQICAIDKNGQKTYSETWTFGINPKRTLLYETMPINIIIGFLIMPVSLIILAGILKYKHKKQSM